MGFPDDCSCHTKPKDSPSLTLSLLRRHGGGGGEGDKNQAIFRFKDYVTDLGFRSLFIGTPWALLSARDWFA